MNKENFKKFIFLNIKMKKKLQKTF
jgi:hypothetical protein